MGNIVGEWWRLMLYASLFVAIPRIVARLVTRGWF
jgi:hypothetical protein